MGFLNFLFMMKGILRERASELPGILREAKSNPLGRAFKKTKPRIHLYGAHHIQIFIVQEMHREVFFGSFRFSQLLPETRYQGRDTRSYCHP